MTPEDSVAIKKYEFDHKVFEQIDNLHYAKDLWPIVYILSDGEVKEAYVGETTDTYARLYTHLRSDQKNKLTAVHLITSEKFNKSATLDIESNLIKYISGDGQYQLLNGNLGLANHNYYQKRDLYWNIFESIWNKLRSEGVTKHSIDYIDNSDLFKYSPYKSLSKEQQQGLMMIIDSLLSKDHNNIIVEGGAGTGKTILAVFLFKLINSDNQDFNYNEFGDQESLFIEKVKSLRERYANSRMALVVPMTSFRETLQQVFKNIKGLSANMVVGPTEITKRKYDIVLVDEAHRLRRRVNLGTYYGAFDNACKRLGLDKHTTNELEWILKQSENSIFFYDENQSIKPSDVEPGEYVSLKQKPNTRIEKLQSQFRVKGGNSYLKYIDQLLDCSLSESDTKYNSDEYEFFLFDSIEDLVQEIKTRNKEHGLSRMIAGYSWEWVSKNDPDKFDIKIDDVELRWNRTSKDWINSETAVDEVGCIHTTQGYDLNYAGIIFGEEISYDKEKDEIVILKENYYDKNGKQSIEDPQELKDFILNIYKTIMLRGIKGTYVYVCDDNLREYFAKHITKFKEEISETTSEATLIPFESSVPLYNLSAAAGEFSDMQRVEDKDFILLPNNIKPSKDLFACKVIGESMNKVIPNGSICLFRKYGAGSRNGQIVLVQHSDIHDSDLGSCYTVKEYQSRKYYGGSQWRHQSITLKPLSYDPAYEAIELKDDELADLKVIGVFERVL